VSAVAFQSLIFSIGIANPSWFGFTADLPVYCDVQIYYDFVKPVLEGQWPYRDYKVEYPVLAIPVFLLPLISGKTFGPYYVGFLAEMMVVNALAVWLVAKQVAKTDGIERVPGRLGWYTLFVAVLSPMIVVRFDLVPMTLAFAAVYATTRGRMVLGGFLAGIGTLVKLVPALVMLPILTTPGPWKPRAKALAGASLTVGLGVLAWWLFAGREILATLRYHGERGLEIGSLYASAYLVAHKLAGVLIVSAFDHGGMNIDASGSKDAAALSTIVQASILVLVAARTRASGPGQEFRFATAALLVYLAFGKVLSPQYLIWLIPFVCVLDGSIGFRSRFVFLVCLGLTSWLYPRLFHSLCHFGSTAVIVVVLRNLALIGLFAILYGKKPAAITPTQSSPVVCS
jgi:hypothetical protein